MAVHITLIMALTYRKRCHLELLYLILIELDTVVRCPFMLFWAAAYIVRVEEIKGVYKLRVRVSLSVRYYFPFFRFFLVSDSPLSEKEKNFFSVNSCCSNLRFFIKVVAFFIKVVSIFIRGRTVEDLQVDLSSGNQKFYIVYLGDSPVFKDSIVDSHINLLPDVVGSELAAKDSIVHSYVNNFNAFAAKLSPDEAKQLESSRGVVSVFPNQQRKLHTTKTWDFLGFPQNVKRKAKLESNLVAGLIDTGITPVSESFNDKGFGPPPAKWKGSCGPYANFSYNNVTWSYQHL
ncbi:cucumisin-like [Papaver somniferum]|uniref:cucumisin-like n=1 Tax=Papaver somniferum TaxID=3469 RepID=UPI000E701B8A|nr:cucumisin-like [Papaver somniferum]